MPLGGRAETFPARGPRSRRPAARYGARTVGRLLYWRPLGYGQGSPRCSRVSIDPQGVGVASPRGAISKPPPWVEISMVTSGVSSVCLMLRGGELAQSAKKEGMSRGVDRLFHQASAPCQVCVQILCTGQVASVEVGPANSLVWLLRGPGKGARVGAGGLPAGGPPCRRRPIGWYSASGPPHFGQV